MKLFGILLGSLVLASSSFASGIFLEASDFNVFVKNNFTGANSDVEGRLAAGGNLSVQNYSIGSALPGGFSGNSLLVGGDFSYNNGQVFRGDVVTSDSTPNTPGLNILNGSMHSGTALPIYIPTLMTELVARSGYVATLATNGTTSFSFGSLSLSGGTGTTRVYNVTTSQLASATNFTIDAPVGTTAVVNILGTNASFQNAGFSLTGGITSSTVLLNFSNATTLTLGGISLQGSVFAPQADVTFNNGNLNGQLIANSFTGSGEMHIAGFNGTVPVPEPASIAALAIGAAALLRKRKK